MDSPDPIRRVQVFEQAVRDGASQRALWDEVAGIVEQLFERSQRASLEHLAARLEGRDELLLAEFLRAHLDLNALDLESALQRFQELAAAVGCSLLPRMHAAEVGLALGREEARAELDQLLKTVFEDEAKCTERELAQLGELMFRSGEERSGMLLAGRYRRRVSGGRAAAKLAEILLAAGRRREAAWQATRALLVWPPPPEALRVIGSLCELRGYGQQAGVLQGMAARLETETAQAVNGEREILHMPIELAAQARAFERRSGSILRRGGHPSEESAAATDPVRAAIDLPPLMAAAAYYIEDFEPLEPVLRRALLRAARRCPAARGLVMRVSESLQRRERPRLARTLLLAAYEAIPPGEEREEIHSQLQILERAQAQATTGEGSPAGLGDEASPAESASLFESAPEIGEDLVRSGRELSAPGIRLQPVHGPCGPVDRILGHLGGAQRRSVLLVGESGVGKTALAHEVVRRIQRGACPESLHGFRVVELTIQDLLVGTEYVGSLQTKMGKLLEQGSVANRILLFLPDIAFTVGAGSYDKSDYDVAASVIPAIGREEILVLGEVRPEELRIARSRRPDFLRWFEKMDLREPEIATTHAIVTATAENLRQECGASVSPEALRRLVELNARFQPGRHFPGKACEFLEQVLRDAGSEVIESENVAAEFARRTGLPQAMFLDSEPLDLEATERFFTDRVLGQPEAVDAVVDQLAMIKAGLARPGRPLGSFFYVGPTGIGKTELARSLAAFLFGSEERLVRLDMSEFSGEDAMWRLCGTPGRRHDPGMRALLTDPVREQPFSVVLFDEIEKAAPRVFDLLLQVLDAGRLTDARGVTTDFCNTILIMTSNLGARRAQEASTGFVPGVRGASEVLKAMEQHFRPEFINRIGRVVVFGELSREDMRKLAFREVGRVLEREGVVRKRLAIEMDPALADFVLEHGFSRRYGARHLQRAVEERVAIPLARTLVRERVARDATLRIYLDGGRTAVELVSLEAPAAEPQAVRTRVDERRLPADLQVLEEVRAEFAGRLEILRSKLETPGVWGRRQELEEEMAAPNFWDQPQRAAEVQHEYAQLVRRIDRIRRLEVRVEELELTIESCEIPLTRDVDRRARRMITGVRAMLDTAEIESLLGEPWDAFDAFVAVSACSRRKEADEWVRALVRMYRRWAELRRMDFELLGELPPEGPSGGGVVVRLIGSNAHGYLQVEHGLHRLVHSGGGGRKRYSHTARVEVAPDLGDGSKVRLAAERRRSAPGIVMPRLARRVRLSWGDDGRTQDVLAPSSSAGDGALAAWLAARREIAARPRGAVEARSGDLVRQYRMGRDTGARDPWTGAAVDGTAGVLGGSIQEFLLARLRRLRGEVDAPGAR